MKQSASEKLIGIIEREYPDAFNLGRAMSLIEALLRFPTSGIERDLAEKFLEEMREEKS